MPDSAEWPPLPKRIGAIARFLAYVMMCLVGVSVVSDVPGNPGEHFGSATITVIGAVCALSGAAAAAGVINRLWRLEFVAIGCIGGAVFVYSAIDWFIVLFVHPELPIRGPAVVTAVFWLLVYRGAGLHVFSRTAVRARRRRTLGLGR